MAEWVAYGDGWEAVPGQRVPRRGVLAIAQSDPVVGRYIVSGHAVYFRWRGQWMGADWFGWLDHLLMAGWGAPALLWRTRFGRSVSNVRWLVLWHRIVADPRLPPKRGNQAGDLVRSEVVR